MSHHSTNTLRISEIRNVKSTFSKGGLEMSGYIGRSVSIIGVGVTKLGDVRTTPEIKDFSEKELYALAAIKAMEDAGIHACDIDAYYVGMSGPGDKSKIKSGAPHFSEWVGLRGKPTLFYDAGCGTTGVGLQMAVNAIACGSCDVVLSGGVNINSTAAFPSVPPHIRRVLPNDEFQAYINTGIDSNYEKIGEGGAAPIEAQAIDYLRKYGYTYADADEAQAIYAIKSREGALSNENAANAAMSFEEEAKQFGFDSAVDYLLSPRYNPVLGSFFRARFIGTACDGAAAIIVCATELAEKYTKKAVEVAGIATASQLHKETRTVPDPMIHDMIQKAYDMAGITDPYNEIQYMGIHEVPAFYVAMCAENAGYLKPGEGLEAMRQGRCAYDGDRPVSTHGGVISNGHPLAPKFNIDVAEAVHQMRGECGARQMKNPPKTALVYGGGSGWNMATAVLKYKG